MTRYTHIYLKSILYSYCGIRVGNKIIILKVLIHAKTWMDLTDIKYKKLYIKEYILYDSMFMKFIEHAK